MGVAKYIEWSLGQLFSGVRGHDDKLVTKSDLFTDVPQNIHVDSPEVGPSGSHMTLKHSLLGDNKFPHLKWTLASDAGISQSDIKEYLLFVEDPDAPIPTPGTHAVYYAIPPTKMEIRPEDIDSDTSQGKGAGGEKWLKGGFRLGKNLRGTLYTGPRPVLGHGEHRYFFEVVALKEKINTAEMSPLATKGEVMQQIRGKIIGWGVWVGRYENKWS
ncbi:hypothetical protein A1O1_01237 [Capronia coronata CBS 617.96]|uniref:Phosphatidylethanolamine-binding protein n=1 Tax=Capronia coronata CBS 617.96 TaxID=1182541 RepID=W9Z3F0_9EURO|nr:uncharacterized protein A1O1_01237 [Capronia coronata CBS 617.96]EXJ96111.1 hypothetical protein A1O1_01237 [Capronia coronata CBS 617.96]